MMYCYIIKESSEIPLKSHRTRPRFEDKLLNNIKQRLKAEGFEDVKLSIREGVITLITKSNERVGQVVSEVFGVHKVCKAICKKFSSLDEIVRDAEPIYRDIVKGKKFAVRVKRAGVHDFTSLDVAAKVGEVLRKYSAGVNLSKPDVTVNIEVRHDMVYYILECWEGVKGLPLGIEGRVITLFSGGFDSTLSSWLAAKRGCEVDLLHFFMGSEEVSTLAFNIAKKLSKWFLPYKPRMYVIDITPLLAEIRLKVRRDYSQVVLRWCMYYMAQKICKIHGCDAIVTGESVGQASSQTLKNISVIEELIPKEVGTKPILRPLSFMDKEEIIDMIRSLNLYDLTSKVREVCRLAEGPVTTRANVEVLSQEISKISKEFLDSLVDTHIVINVLETDIEEFKKLMEGLTRDIDIKLDEVKDKYVLVDVRPKHIYDKEHLPNAIHISKLLSSAESVDRNIIYVLYCDHGTLSNIYAKLLRKLGLRAYSLKGGLRRLKP